MLEHFSAEQLVYAHDLVDPDNLQPSSIDAANYLLDCAHQNEQSFNEHARDYATAVQVLQGVLSRLLNQGAFQYAAFLCWGSRRFNPKPYLVRKVWDNLGRHKKLLIMGCGAGGKSYNVLVHDLLDWSRDPFYTTIKIISTTAGHARAQTMSTLVQLHRESIVPLPGYIVQGFIGLDKDDRRSSISELAIDKGSELLGKSGKLQGFHPYPRRKAHPLFGSMSRVRARLEEAEDIPEPVWPGITNMMLTAGGGNVAVAAMWNPKRTDSMIHQKAEPLKGWGNFDPEKDEEWESTAGFHVLRLDGKKCENVIERRVIYEGLIDYEGYNQYDETSPEFWTFSRGCYPPQIISFGIIGLQALEKRRGEFIWARHPTEIGTVDMAEEGKDKAFYTASKYGLAMAWRQEGRGPIPLEPYRWVLQAEQQFPIPKQNTILMGQEIIRLSRLLHVRPEHFGLDITGSVILRDWLRLKWGDVLGVQWAESATDLPIIEESPEKASDLYDNIKTEMWFCTGSWVEFGYMGFSPAMNTRDLFAQLSGMKYIQVSKTLKRCEQTKVFKKRFGGMSPDEAASLIMSVHVVRLRLSDYNRNVAMDPARAAQNAVMPSPEAILQSREESEVLDAIEFI